MVFQKEIDGTVYHIRDDMTIGELGRVQDLSIEIDLRTLMPLTKNEKLRAHLISLCLVEPKMTLEEAMKLPAGRGLRLYAAIHEANGIPL